MKFDFSTKDLSFFCICSEENKNTNKLSLAIYGILNPNVQWTDLPSTSEINDEILHKCTFVNINKTRKVEILNQIITYQPNIVIFAGTFKEFEPTDLEEISWDISHSTKRYVNDEKQGITTTFYITSPTKLCIDLYNPNDFKISSKTLWYELKKTVEWWEEFR